MDRNAAPNTDPGVEDTNDNHGPMRLPGNRRQLIGRASLNLMDQAISALTNVVLSFLVARAVSATGFGAFSVAFLVFTLLIGLERALVGQPMSIRFSHAVGDERSRVVGAAMATIFAVTVVAGIGAAIAGALISGMLGLTLLALAVGLPGLILQDTCRMTFFAQSRPHLAVVNDLVWAAVQFGIMGVLYAQGVDEPWPYVLAWSGAATVAALLGLIQLRAVPRFDEIVWWTRSQFDIVGYLLLEFLIGAGSVQGSVLLVGVVGSLGDVGSFRAALTLLGPLVILNTAIMSFLLPELSRRKHTSRRTRIRIATVVSATVVVGSLIYTTGLLLLPDSVGSGLLGSTWPGADSVLLPLALSTTAATASLGPAIIIYSMGQARKTLMLHAIEAPLLIICMAVGLVVGQTTGAAWGMAISMTIMIPLWFWQMNVLLRVTPEQPSLQPEAVAD